MADLDAAIGYVVAHGDQVDRARLSWLLSGIAPNPDVLATVEMGQTRSGGWPAFWGGDVPSIDATCFRLAELDDLGALGLPPAQRALTWLAGKQRPDGTWEEDAALAGLAPSWAKPGDPEARLYLTVSAGYWLAVAGPAVPDPVPAGSAAVRVESTDSIAPGAEPVGSVAGGAEPALPGPRGSGHDTLDHDGSDHDGSAHGDALPVAGAPAFPAGGGEFRAGGGEPVRQQLPQPRPAGSPVPQPRPAPSPISVSFVVQPAGVPPPDPDTPVPVSPAGHPADPRAGAVSRATEVFRSAMAPDGSWPSYLAAGWLGASLLYLAGLYYESARAQIILSERIPEMSPADVALLAAAARRVDISVDEFLLTAARNRLTETQRSDGGWPSDDGGAFDVHTTLTAIRALR